MKLPYLVRGEDVFLIDPRALRVWIALPFDKVLQFASFAEPPRFFDFLDFIFFFSVDQFWRWALIVGPMCYCLVIGCEKIDVKHGVNAPLRGKFKAINNR